MLASMDQRSSKLEDRVDVGFKSLNQRLTNLEDEFKDFRKEFIEFKNQNLILLDRIYKLLKDGEQELLVVRHRVNEDHEPRILDLETKTALA